MGRSFASLVSTVAVVDSAIGLAIFLQLSEFEVQFFLFFFRSGPFLKVERFRYWVCALSGIDSVKGILLYRQNIAILSMPTDLMFCGFYYWVSHFFTTFRVSVVNSNLLIFFVSSDDVMGQAFASLVSMVVVADSTIGLAIFLQLSVSEVQGLS
ncbi:NADH-ubiquinone oxidoreductase chain 4L, partial [Mucuna pruriens]